MLGDQLHYEFEDRLKEELEAELQGTEIMTSSPAQQVVDVLIVGCGPTGLGAATRLHQIEEFFRHSSQTATGRIKRPLTWLLKEQRSEAGGLACTDTTKEGFLFDVGGHVIFSHFEYFDRLLETSVGPFNDPTAWLTHQRVSYVRYKNAWVPYPFQNNLHYIPAEDQLRAINGLVEAKLEDVRREASTTCKSPPANFDEWFGRTMGDGLAEIFMRPYNFKAWATPPSKMHWNWLGERVSVVDPFRAIQSCLLKKDDIGWGPNAVFRFPVKGATGSIWKVVAARLPSNKLEFNEEMVEVDLERREATFRNVSTGETNRVTYTYLINTSPLDVFMDRAHPALTFERAKDKLMHSSTHVIGLGMRGTHPHGAKCWLYFPESNCNFYRATVFSNYSPANCPSKETRLRTIRLAGTKTQHADEALEEPGPYWSLMLEVSETAEFKPVNMDTIIQDAIDGCLNAGLLQFSDEIVSIHHRRLEYGYPTPTLERDKALQSILPELESTFGVFSRGRFGCYKYEVGNQDHSLVLGVEAVDRIMFKGEETTFNRPGYVNRAVGSQKNTSPPFDVSSLFLAGPPTVFQVHGDSFPTNVAWLGGKVFDSVEEYVAFVHREQRRHNLPSE